MSFFREFWATLRPSHKIVFGGSALAATASTAYLVKSEFIDRPAFSPDEAQVVFVLGGPGVGKGTQCKMLKERLGFIHLSAGDLLREERERPGSQFGDIINKHITDGTIVPMSITISLLEKEMRKYTADSRKTVKFLIDGFPRAVDQAIEFEKRVVKSKGILFFECPMEEMEKRLLLRSKTSGRSDDNAEVIKKRFITFEKTSMPVIDLYRRRVDSTVAKVSCLDSPEEVFRKSVSGISSILCPEQK